MAILAKGSRGNDVKALQTRLNKSGARPPLKVDGDFGPVTEAAVKSFQKKTKLKPDGRAGDETQAAADYGKPLPEMTVPSYDKAVATHKAAAGRYSTSIEVFYDIRKSVESLQTTWKNMLSPIAGTFDGASIYRQEFVEAGEKIGAKQKEFVKLRASDPKKAEQLVKDCEALQKEAQSAEKALQGTLTSLTKAIALTRKSVKEESESILQALQLIDNQINRLKTR